jgi:folate-binding protein YgfZ
MDSASYQAARNGAAVLKQPWLEGIVRLSGPDRIAWLQGMVTNDVEKLRPGEGTYAANLNAQGKLIAHMTILVDADALWLTLETSNVKKLAGVLEPMIVMEDVMSENCTGQFESIAVLGPSAASLLETWAGEPLKLEKLYSHRSLSEDCQHIVRDDLGFTLWVTAGKADALAAQLEELGAVSIDEATWNIVRVENGLPIYGVDIDETTSLPELGEKGISYDKGCYIGQEVVARIKYIGHVNRRFVGFVCEGDVPPEPKCKVMLSSKEVGYVTSSVTSMGLNKPVALGFVSRLAAAAGTDVELHSGGRTISAKVSDLPIVH